MLFFLMILIPLVTAWDKKDSFLTVKYNRLIFFNGFTTKYSLNKSEEFCKSIGFQLVDSEQDLEFLKDDEFELSHDDVWLDFKPPIECSHGIKCCGSSVTKHKSESGYVYLQELHYACEHLAHQVCRMTSKAPFDVINRVNHIETPEYVSDLTERSKARLEENKIKVLESEAQEIELKIEYVISGRTVDGLNPKLLIHAAESTIAALNAHRFDSMIDDVAVARHEKIRDYKKKDLNGLWGDVVVYEKTLRTSVETTDSLYDSIYTFLGRILENEDSGSKKIQEADGEVGTAKDGNHEAIKKVEIATDIKLNHLQKEKKALIDDLVLKATPTRRARQDLETLTTEINRAISEANLLITRAKNRMDLINMSRDEEMKEMLEIFRDSNYRKGAPKGFRVTATALLIFLSILVVINSFILFTSMKISGETLLADQQLVTIHLTE